MGRWKGWYCFKFTNSFLSSTKGLLFKLTSCLSNKAKGHKNGLLSLYKDMEACGGYEDIQVMWEMIHSSSSAENIKRNDKPPYWRFCFATT
ncbi:hypothetical protein L6452_36932 [Arctium lappa]|uniref:Uncharacterized protein n=1 Tax=Arctium lappa TaxID=4217 RepID=A0ACB8Y0Z6_ARCLA|nr:hypothetical protein L6452_36932 [Arctium lappa]